MSCAIKSFKNFQHNKTVLTKIKVNKHFFLILGIMMISTGCPHTRMSEEIADNSAGLNGGFETSQNGLPVNWLIYTPNTVPDAEFKIILDREVYKEGEQSLKFEVEKCSAIGGWYSPGFTNEFFKAGKYEGEGRYKLSFWIKNNGTKFRIKAGGVEAFKGDMQVLIESDEKIEDWQFLEYEIYLPKDKWLRMELNILHPGIFWIDDIKIQSL